MQHMLAVKAWLLRQAYLVGGKQLSTRLRPRQTATELKNNKELKRRRKSSLQSFDALHEGALRSLTQDCSVNTTLFIGSQPNRQFQDFSSAQISFGG